MRDSRFMNTRVYVGNLTESVKKEDLEEEFNKFGYVNSVWVAFNPPGFAFVEYADQQDAESACYQLNGSEMFGVKLRVELSRPRRSQRGAGGRFDGNRRGFNRGPPGGGYRGYDGGRFGGGGSNTGYNRSHRNSDGERFRSRSPQYRHRY